MSHATIAPWRDRWFIAYARFASRYKDDGSVTFHVTTLPPILTAVVPAGAGLECATAHTACRRPA